MVTLISPGLSRPSRGSVIEGRWVRLAPVAAYPPAAMRDLRFRLGLRPEMVAPGLDGEAAGSSRFGDAAVIADAETGQPLGVLGNVELGDYPGVAALVIYVDEARTRPGYAMEAWFRYVDRVFQLGAAKVQMEVMSFNTPVHRIMRRIGARPEVVLREHFYVAGRHWDGTLYAFDRAAWRAVDRRYREVVARPVALAGSRHETEEERLWEGNKMDVDYLILADAAISADGKHYLHGAGWDSIVASAFPVFHRRISAALRLRVAPGEPAHRVSVDVVGPDGSSLLTSPIYTDVAPDPGATGEQGVCLAFNFDGLRLAEPGTYAVVAGTDGVETRRTPFHVRLVG